MATAGDMAPERSYEDTFIPSAVDPRWASTRRAACAAFTV